MTGLRRRVAGLLATLLILAIVAGLPVVLLAVGANPFAGGVPGLESIKAAFTTPDDGTLAIGVIKVLAWASWMFLTGSILLELAARIRGVRAPRLTGLSLPQSAAKGLVGAAALLFVAVPVTTAAAASPASATPATRPAVVATQTHRPATTQAAAPSQSPHQARASETAAQKPAPATVEHKVKRGETLWSIAQQHLGDGHRYKEIYELNRGVMVDGPSFLKQGWTLRLPAPPAASSARAGEMVVVEKGDTLSQIAQEELGDAARYPEIVEASRAIEQPGHAHLTDPDLIYPGWTLKIPPQATPSAPVTPQATPSAPVTPQATPSAAPSVPASAEHLQEDSAWMARTGYGVGAVLAAGVLALIASRRRTQQRRRRPGQRVPLPQGAAAQVEQELRATADQLSVETVDRALRGLAQACAGQGTPLPVVRAARLTASQFDLYLAEPAQLPEPWSGTADTTVWTLEVDDAAAVEDLDVHDVPAPYPGLVTIGHDDEDGHVFLDLEYLGALGVTGPSLATREILAALAVELATSVWADDLQVTVVGAFPELEDTLRTGRIRYLPSVGRVLEDLLHRADVDRRALAAGGAHDLHAARVTGAAPDAWSPEIVLLAGEITDRQRNQLEQLVDDLPRVALAAVTSGATVGEWSLDLTAGDQPDLAILNPIGLQLRPQRLPAEQYGHLLEIASLTEVDELDGDYIAEPSLAEVEAVTPVDEEPNEPEKPAPDLPEVSWEQLEAAEARDAAEDPEPSEVMPTATDQPAPVAGEPTVAATTAVSVQDGLGDEDAEQAAPERAQGQEPAAEAPVSPMPLPAPQVLVMGPVDLLNAGGKVEPSKRARLLEYAAYLALHPGATHTAIDDAIWPDRKTEDNLNTRNPATSKLRRWVGTDPEGTEYLPRHQAGEGYAFLPSVTTDVDRWDQLLAQVPADAPTEHLEAALALVRGIPFEGTHRKRYAWAEPIKQRLISEIVDASYELARRRLMEGRWRAAEQAVVVGLRIEPAQENLWRLRILAAHESRNRSAEAEAIDRLLTITDELECELEPETEQLLVALKNPGTDFDQLMANAL